MATLAELLQQIEGGQRSEFGAKGMGLTKAGADDLRALREYEIALKEEAEERKRGIGQAKKRGSASRLATKFVDWITQSPVGSLLSKPLQERTKTHRFTLSSPFGERVKDPFRALETKAPDTTFYSTSAKKLGSEARTIKDFLSDAEKTFDDTATINALTDAFTSYQTKAAGFTPEYAGDIFKDIGSGEGIFESIKGAEASRRKTLMDEYIANLSKAKVGADGGAASSISQEAFGKNFGMPDSKWAIGGQEPFKLGRSISSILENPNFRNILPKQYSRTGSDPRTNKQISNIYGFDKNLLDLLEQYGFGGVQND
jgi:hypothetical protein